LRKSYLDFGRLRPEASDEHVVCQLKLVDGVLFIIE
jgi:hypothetical protein